MICRLSSVHRHPKTNQIIRWGVIFFPPDFPDEHRQVSWYFLQVAEQTGGLGSAALVLLPTISHVSLAQVQPARESPAAQVWDRARESFTSLLKLRLWGAVGSVSPARVLRCFPDFLHSD